MSQQDQWAAVDKYLNDMLVTPDAVLDQSLADSVAAGLPPISVTPNQGKLLHLFALSHGAKNILEIGTLGAYSTIWLARALPAGGKLVSLEAVPKHAEVARANLARAGLSNTVEVILGNAHESLPRLLSENRGPFDLIFIDADKASYPDYFKWSLKLSRKGTLIIADNVVRNGGVVDPNTTDANNQGVRKLFEMVAKEPRVRATAIQTVCSKGYDGFAMMVVME